MGLKMPASHNLENDGLPTTHFSLWISRFSPYFLLRALLQPALRSHLHLSSSDLLHCFLILSCFHWVPPYPCSPHKFKNVSQTQSYLPTMDHLPCPLTPASQPWHYPYTSAATSQLFFRGHTLLTLPWHFAMLSLHPLPET